ncbi:hypothetical protein CIB84_008059 [Bambusicola thoracicus]|uniref:Uncharacterized protein n=1 Tax=Bambusicola thoracicus TaxID=9083 RepID=A0A2P4SVP0_BAMTH|nr:hypothetical protein CIB84_008059 [Bambusicola thoracicus]
MFDTLLRNIYANDVHDSSSAEDDWETRFHFMANKKDEEEKLMFRSQVKVWHCFLNRKTALSLQVFNIKSLQVLVLRSNPIREIPNDIHRLKSLKKFTISFNLLSELPSGLFLLEDLWYLDIAYNYISSIPNDIKNLRIENNFIHPLLWNEKIQNQPQKLIHLAALCFSTNNLKERYNNISEDIKKILDE